MSKIDALYEAAKNGLLATGVDEEYLPDCFRDEITRPILEACRNTFERF